MHARYRLANTIGQGSMGTISRAYDRLTHTWVALKQLHLQQPAESLIEATNRNLRTVLAAEFRLLATLRHPHIVSVLDYGFLGQTAFFTMEFLPEAVPLVAAAHAEPLSVQLQWLAQLLQALEYLRRHRVVHRDLKPANVLVQQGQVKVLDFGLATFEGQHSPTAGSLLYMAPEAFADQPLTHATDLYAVGVMAYEMLAGQHPFATTDAGLLLQHIFTTEPDCARLQGPQALQVAVARLLAKDPAARFATAAEALAALNAASADPVPLETQATRASFIQAAQFVGREKELAQLTTALINALAGKGSAWLVGGESGVGKSRLLDELRVQALVLRAWVWRGQAVSDGGQPLHVWHPILVWLLLHTTPTDLEASVLKPFIPQIEELLERPVPEAPPLEAAPAQTRFCATVLALLRQATAQQPLVLLLEDLHWADPLSLTLLNWLNRAAPDLRLLIVTTYRDDERPDLPEQLPHMSVQLLRRLEMGQVTALASAILGLPAQQLQPLAEFLYRETAGNAFFLVEVLRSLAEEAGLLSQVTQMALPQQLLVGGIQQVVQRRLQRIAPANRPYLTLAAIGGRQLDIDLLRHLAPNLALAKWLAQCAEVAVLEPVGAGWQFAHDQLRVGVLAAVPPAEQAALHQAVAEAIEQVYAHDLTAHLGQLVHHYAHTPQTRKLRQYLAQAGQAALAACAYRHAEQYFTQALALTSATELAERYTLLLAREQTYHVQGARAAQAQDLAELAQLAQTLADARGQVEIALRQAAYYSELDDYAHAIAAAAQAFALAQAHPDVERQALAQLRWSTALYYQGHYAQAEEHLALAQALAAPQIPTIAIDALRLLSNIRRRQKRLAEAHTLVAEGLRLAREIKDREREMLALTSLGMVTAAQGHFTESVHYQHQALQLTRELGYPLWELVNLNSLGAKYELYGLYAQAQACLMSAIQIAQEIGERQVLASSLLNLGHVHRDQGALLQAQTYYEQSRQVLQAIGQLEAEGIVLTGLGHTLVLLGQSQAALAFFQQALALHQKAAQLDLAAEAQAGLAWAWLQQNQLPLALAQVELILQHLPTGNLQNTEEPFLIYLICYRVLQAAGDARAPEVLATAFAKLQAEAAQLDTATRQAFLENVPCHREIIQARSSSLS